MKHIVSIEIILYVNDQKESTSFYKKLFRCTPDLEVPGMTEFILGDHCKLGLMPNSGIVKILQNKVPHPETGNGIPRCELYLHTENLDFEFENALQSGAKLISPAENRDWGDKVCYFADPDGHIIAFAQKMNNADGNA